MPAENGAPTEPGAVIAGRYRIVKVLAETDIGTLLEARHIHLDDLVIVKILSHRVHDARLAAKFVREARHAAKVKSDHVARFIDVGRLDDNRPFVVMEHLEGEDLETISRRSPGGLPVVDVVDWGLEACDALAAAHAVGIVHRDLRTSSLFLAATTSGERRVKVLNFGTSRIHDGGREEDPGLTVAGLASGSPHYQAPELFIRASAANAQADVWSLGVVFYELLTGVRPFDGSPEDVVKHILVEPPTPPSAIRSDIPLALAAIILRCLEKRPEARYPSIPDLAAALLPFASDVGRVLATRVARASDGALRLVPIQLSDPPTEPEEEEALIHRRVGDSGSLEKASYADLHNRSEDLHVRTNKPRRRRWLGQLAPVLVLSVAAVVAWLVTRPSSSSSTTELRAQQTSSQVSSSSTSTSTGATTALNTADTSSEEEGNANAKASNPPTTVRPRPTTVVRSHGSGSNNRSSTGMFSATSAAGGRPAPPGATDPWGWKR